MTESKIGYLCSRRNIRVLDLIGTDWRGERGQAARFSKILKYRVTGHFPNIVHQFSIEIFLFVYSSLLNVLQTPAFSDCFHMPQAGGIFSCMTSCVKQEEEFLRI